MLYLIGYWFFKVFFKVFYSSKVFGIENVPSQGPGIIASNHTSNWDPPLIGSSIKRKDIYYLSKDELFRNFILRFIFSRVHAFPVKRNRIDKKALRKALEVIKKGHLLLIFPEGTRREKERYEDVFPGISFLARRTGVKVIPGFVLSPRLAKFFNKSVTVAFSEPIRFSDSEDDYDFAQRVMREIQKEEHKRAKNKELL